MTITYNDIIAIHNMIHTYFIARPLVQVRRAKRMFLAVVTTIHWHYCTSLTVTLPINVTTCLV